ncbi:MAG TPA: glycosyltransferase family 4 protein [Candidatus Acidoferrum sp.]|nr:glycosyltransferase family 4 protein [Candidatus Acidoferrum sp.]
MKSNFVVAWESYLQGALPSLYNSVVRVLLLNLYYPPDTSATAKMANTVVEAIAVKHDVTVLCGRPSYDPTERRVWHLYQTEEAGRVRVIRVGSTDYPRVQMKKRVFNYLSYVLLAVPRALALRCDVLLAMTDPPFEGIVGAFVAMLKNKPYIYNIRDMYPDMAVGGSIVKPGLLARVWEKLHRWALRRATRVIVLGEDMRNRILAKGVDPTRVVIVRDGAEIPVREGMTQKLDDSVIGAIRGQFRFVLLHAGNLGFYGAWDTLLEGARRLAADGVGLVFVGDGAQRERLESASSSIPNVRFLPFFPAGKIPSVLAAPDAHIITVKRGLEGVVVPSKMYGILAAGKPIMAVAPAECDVVSIGKRKGFSISADPDDPEEFVKRIRELLSNAQRLHRMGEAAELVAPEYERRQELQKLVGVVEESHRE